MKEYQRILKENNIQQSMSRKGNCLDNSIMENFFGNNERIILKLKMSPVKYRTQNQII